MVSKSYRITYIFIFSLVLCMALQVDSAMARTKYSLYLARLVPGNQSVDGLAPKSLGTGAAVTTSVLHHNTFAEVNFGLEYFKFSKDIIKNVDYYPYGTVDVENSQDYYRIYTGGRIGLNGKGAFRPFVGTNLGFTFYAFATNLVSIEYTGGDFSQGREVRRNVYSRTKAVFGYDLNLGAELMLAPKFILESGVRYLNSFNAPGQFETNKDITIQRDFYQIYLSLGALFGG